MYVCMTRCMNYKYSYVYMYPCIHAYNIMCRLIFNIIYKNLLMLKCPQCKLCERRPLNIFLLNSCSKLSSIMQIPVICNIE